MSTGHETSDDERQIFAETGKKWCLNLPVTAYFSGRPEGKRQKMSVPGDLEVAGDGR
jgi:hypothetical protein